VNAQPELWHLRIGDAFVSEAEPVTTTQLVMYAGASGDFNRIHYDHAYALEAKLGGVIAHGMLTMAFMGRALTDRLGPGGRVSRISARFTAPVRPGDVVRVTGTVRELSSAGAALELDCDLIAIVGDRKVAEGSARLLREPGPPQSNREE
jgi:acyl dehydratase